MGPKCPAPSGARTRAAGIGGRHTNKETKDCSLYCQSQQSLFQRVKTQSLFWKVLLIKAPSHSEFPGGYGSPKSALPWSALNIKSGPVPIPPSVFPGQFGTPMFSLLPLPLYFVGCLKNQWCTIQSVIHFLSVLFCGSGILMIFFVNGVVRNLSFWISIALSMLIALTFIMDIQKYQINFLDVNIILTETGIDTSHNMLLHGSSYHPFSLKRSF